MLRTRLFSVSNMAFTLVELLVVITIIAILAAITLPVMNSVQLTGKRTVALSNMRQLGTGTMLYAGQDDNQLPLDKISSSTDSWTVASASTSDGVWYNCIPKMMGKKATGDYSTNRAAFYSKDCLMYCLTAKYPSDAATQASPLFAIVMNSKLNGTGVRTRLQNIQMPMKTALYIEAGLPNETKTYSNESSYNGQPAAFSSRFKARYPGKTTAGKGLVTFLDGHADLLEASDVVDSTKSKGAWWAGAAVDPPVPAGKVVWLPDPTIDPNS